MCKYKTNFGQPTSIKNKVERVFENYSYIHVYKYLYLFFLKTFSEQKYNIFYKTAGVILLCRAAYYTYYIAGTIDSCASKRKKKVREDTGCSPPRSQTMYI